ncbi:MAG TPA: putative phage tail protein [Acetobacteraceae bacterium]|nr:putative phage tail protein [Acetobacteraceae bacterium]
MSNSFLKLSPDDFRRGTAGAIPRGYAWMVAPDSVQGQVWAGLAASVQPLHARVGDLSEREFDPARTVELLADWERAYGLPDHCTPLNATIQQRQAALVARIARQGGQSIAYHVSAAAALGYSATITAFQQFRVGRSRVGGPPWPGLALHVAGQCAKRDHALVPRRQVGSRRAAAVMGQRRNAMPPRRGRARAHRSAIRLRLTV